MQQEKSPFDIDGNALDPYNTSNIMGCYVADFNVDFTTMEHVFLRFAKLQE